MRYPCAFLAGLAGFAIAGPAPLRAQLVTIIARGSCEFLQRPELAPEFLPAEVTARFAFKLAGPDPVSADGWTVRYRPWSAAVTIGGRFFELADAALIVTRREDGAAAGSGYQLSGWTKAERWWFSVDTRSSSPGYAPDFRLPAGVPDPGLLDRAHDIDFSDTLVGWGGYGDGAIVAVTFTPVPEPATTGLVGAVALGLLVWRRCQGGRSRAGGASLERRVAPRDAPRA